MPGRSWRGAHDSYADAGRADSERPGESIEVDERFAAVEGACDFEVDLKLLASSYDRVFDVLKLTDTLATSVNSTRNDSSSLFKAFNNCTAACREAVSL